MLCATKDEGQQDTSEQGSVAAFQDKELDGGERPSEGFMGECFTTAYLAVVHHNDFLRLRTWMAKTGTLGTMRGLAFGHKRGGMRT